MNTRSGRFTGTASFTAGAFAVASFASLDMADTLYAYGTGDLVDCVAWGQDPQGFIDDIGPGGNTYATYNARPQESDFVGCRAL